MSLNTSSASFRERLIDRNHPMMIGSFHEFRDPQLIETVSRIGFDFLVIEQQLGLRDPAHLEHLIRAADVTDTPVLIRVGLECDEGFVSRVLSAGAVGLVASFDGTAAYAEKLVSWMKYPPEGVRAPGYCRGGSGYRKRVPWMFGAEENKRMEQANQDVVLVLRFETKEAVDNVKEILAVDGVTGIMPSPGNICTNMNIPAGSPKLGEIIADLHVAAKEIKDKVVFRFVMDGAGAEAAAKAGAAAAYAGHDTTFIAGWYQELYSSLKEGAVK
jgi:2-dehydro-3-deoxy-L-rhamnonate aldolase